jgi:hypothetical protein
MALKGENYETNVPCPRMAPSARCGGAGTAVHLRGPSAYGLGSDHADDVFPGRNFESL